MQLDLGLGAYGGWWRSQMAALLGSMLPARLRPAPRPVRIVWLGHDGHVEPAAAAGEEAGPLILGLPPGWLLARDVTLPAAVGRDLAAAIRFEMDRLTPFTADELHWSVRLSRRDPARGMLHARLALVPRTQIDPVLARLDAAGLAPDALSDGTDEIKLPAGLARAQAERQRLAWLASACVVLAALAAAVPFLRVARQTDAIEARIAALQPQADAAQRLRNQLARRNTAATAFTHARAATGDALTAIAAVTRSLPDDTHITSLGLHQMHLSIDGESGSAAKLIGRIAADPALREPNFAAPVTSTGTHDLFSIHATLAPPDAPASAPTQAPPSPGR